jgi:type IV pilus assembly protein PilQ
MKTRKNGKKETPRNTGAKKNARDKKINYLFLSLFLLVALTCLFFSVYAQAPGIEVQTETSTQTSTEGAAAAQAENTPAAPSETQNQTQPSPAPAGHAQTQSETPTSATPAEVTQAPTLDAAQIQLKSEEEPKETEGIIPVIKFKDADIRVVLQAIAEKATRDGKKINIVLSPKVEGLVSVNLENVDWQTALEVVVKTYGYGYMRFKDIIIIAPMEEIKQREAQERERQGVEPAQLKVFRLKFLDANDARKAIEPLLSPAGRLSVLEFTGQAGWEFGQDITKRQRTREGRISRTKVLLVSDVSGKLEEISALLKEIDVMPKQVYIKARIMEVNRDLLRDLGLDWGTGTSGAETATGMSNIPLSSGTSDTSSRTLAMHSLSDLVTPSVFGPKTTTLSSSNTGLRMVFKHLTGTELEIVIHALEEDARSNTLSAPNILTLNNQEASILIGTKFPIVKTQISEQSSQIIGGSLERYQDIGIQLNVVPQICGDHDGFINMIVHPAVTSYSETSKIVSGNTTLVEYPIIISREAETQILLKDGETIVIGGLLKDVKGKQNIGIPFLGKIPILGRLFQRDTYDTEKVDLLIFITAHIVKPGEVVPQEVVDTVPVTSKFGKKLLAR